LDEKYEQHNVTDERDQTNKPPITATPGIVETVLTPFDIARRIDEEREKAEGNR
jgi:hypothetical protein